MVNNSCRLWRLCRAPYAAGAFSGEGAFRYGARWTPPGVTAVYCSDSRSLAAMEILVHHIDTEIFKLTRWLMTPADVPKTVIELPARVPTQWRELPPVAEVQAFGATWVREGRSAVLRVPSAVVLGEFNYVLNPSHPDFAKIAIGPPEDFNFDARIKR